MRATDTFQKIKDEIINDPNLRGYIGKSPSEIAILMNQNISYNPKQFITQSVDKRQIIVSKLTDVQVNDIIAYSKLKGYFVDTDFTDKQVEILTSRSDLLSLGFVSQGDVEQALK